MQKNQAKPINKQKKTDKQNKIKTPKPSLSISKFEVLFCTVSLGAVNEHGSLNFPSRLSTPLSLSTCNFLRF